jgi:hypothetical protein
MDIGPSVLATVPNDSGCDQGGSCTVNVGNACHDFGVPGDEHCGRDALVSIRFGVGLLGSAHVFECVPSP